MGNGEEIESDEPTGKTIEIVPEEPRTLVFLATGIVVIVGIGRRSRIARYLRSLCLLGNYDVPKTQVNRKC